MEKQRVIIADPDLHYIIPLQQKLLDAFPDSLDLEIITDREYFEALFSSPQKAGILIISEDFYSPSVRRHYIPNVFLMTEKDCEPVLANDGVLPIYKYTSVKEIFSIIIGQSRGIIDEDSGEEKTTRIILVCSACGGVGKTTVALGVSACLSNRYQKVLYMNASRFQGYQPLLKEPDPITMQMASLENQMLYSSMKHLVRNEGFSYLPPFRDPLMAMGIPYSAFLQFAITAKESGDFDYLIVDCDSVLDEDKIKLIDLADKVVVVANQHKSAAVSTNMWADCINTTVQDKFLFICNDYQSEETDYLSKNADIHFMVSESIRHCSDYDNLSAADLAKRADVQRVAFLIV